MKKEKRIRTLIGITAVWVLYGVSFLIKQEWRNTYQFIFFFAVLGISIFYVHGWKEIKAEFCKKDDGWPNPFAVAFGLDKKKDGKNEE
ncbi:MAG: hypothetical protein LBU80_05205 [Rikenellaceae bacterium]|jgi:hypothetical protein|nr:hypothetical protein [Rikenellaceae bacterium]